MSSSVSGKFQDHYIALGVEPRADSETIQAAYTKLAQKYHPSNSETGNPVQFEAINLAYEVLSDPALRVEFDKLKGIDPDGGNPAFTGIGFFQALKQAALLRSAILCVLCDRRRIKPTRPTMSVRHLETMLLTTNDELNFAMWYLKQRGYVINDDKSNLQLTADGMDYLEKNPPQVEAVMALIKADSISGESAPAPNAMSALQRVLSRDHASHPLRAGTPALK